MIGDLEKIVKTDIEIEVIETVTDTETEATENANEATATEVTGTGSIEVQVGIEREGDTIENDTSEIDMIHEIETQEGREEGKMKVWQLNLWVLLRLRDDGTRRINSRRR